MRKSGLQRRQEQDLFRRQSADRALRQARRFHYPSHAIARIFSGEIDEETVVDEPLRIIVRACRKQHASAGLPAPLTKRMAHWFTEAPDHYDPRAAIRYGQVRAPRGRAGHRGVGRVRAVIPGYARAICSRKSGIVAESPTFSPR